MGITKFYTIIHTSVQPLSHRSVCLRYTTRTNITTFNSKLIKNLHQSFNVYTTSSKRILIKRIWWLSLTAAANITVWFLDFFVTDQCTIFVNWWTTVAFITSDQYTCMLSRINKNNHGLSLSYTVASTQANILQLHVYQEELLLSSEKILNRIKKNINAGLSTCFIRFLLLSH